MGLVTELSSRGRHVTATVREPAKAADLKAVPGVAIEGLDIDNPAMVEALVARLGNAQFDLVFVNAGVIGPRERTAETVTHEEVAQIFQINAASPVRLTYKLRG